MAIAADRNIVQKEADKKLKYKSLCIETQRMLNMKCVIISLITGANGTVKKTFKENFGSHNKKNSTGSLQRASVLGNLET